MKVDPISSMTGGNMHSRGANQFTDVEKRDELARECNLRKSVYPGMVRSRRMTHEQAERQKAIMHAIWLDYCGRVNADNTQPQAALDLSTPTVQQFTPPSEPEVIGVDLGAGDDRSAEISISIDETGQSCASVNSVESDSSCSVDDGSD